MTCASIIIPHRPDSSTFERTLESVNMAARGVEAQIIQIEDKDGRGPSWARNRGLDQAEGEYIFFVDDDDLVKENFLRRPLAELKRSNADIAFFSYVGGPALSSYTLETNSEIRAAYLPAFFGYSFDDVRRWNSGGDLMLLKEPGQVWRCAFRREFLERNSIRFDEAMTFYEDAAFLSHSVAFASRSVSMSDELYEYIPRAEGNLASGSGSRRHWDYKFASLEFRKRLDRLAGGGILKYCQASLVFTALELGRIAARAGLDKSARREGIRRYLADENVREAVRSFPVSWLRHPLVAAAVTALRWKI